MYEASEKEISHNAYALKEFDCDTSTLIKANPNSELSHDSECRPVLLLKKYSTIALIGTQWNRL